MPKDDSEKQPIAAQESVNGEHQERSVGGAVESPADQPTIPSNDQFINQNMEVHHHPETEKKNFKQYLLEGLMIFLAVMLGFFAENLRESISESHREKEYAKELYAELRSDSIEAANKLVIRLEKERDMDYISNYMKDSSLTSLPKQFYPAYTTSFYLINSYTFEPKDGILSQLKYSGSQRFFKGAFLQRLLGDMSVCINNIRYRNDQEYQFFSNPLKLFLLKHYDFGWLNELRKSDTAAYSLDLINHYRNSNQLIKGSILNPSLLDRAEASNMILFYKQMLISSQSLQLNNYIKTNHKILETLRQEYPIADE